MRYGAYALSMLLLLTACSEQGGESYYESINYASAPPNTIVQNPYGLAHAWATPAYMQASVPDPPATGDAFTYSHTVRLEMARNAIRPHFERARDNCLNDAGLSCSLVSSTVDIGSPC